MTAHASDARTQKRSSLKGNRDTRRARLPRQQPPGRHGIVSPNRNQKEPAMLRIKAGSKPSASASGNTSNSSKQLAQQLAKAVPGMERHHAFGSPTSWATNAPRGGLALASAALRVLIIHGRNRKNPNHKAEHHEPTGQMLDRLAIARNGDRHPRRKASDHPARHTPGPPLTRRSDTRRLDRRRVEDRRWQPPDHGR